LDVLVSEIRLQRSGIVTTIRDRITTRMSQHVRMRLEAELRLDARSLDHTGEVLGVPPHPQHWRIINPPVAIFI
jgi:hypothetical protein